jgi:hypothetical protein
MQFAIDPKKTRSKCLVLPSASMVITERFQLLLVKTDCGFEVRWILLKLEAVLSAWYTYIRNQRQKLHRVMCSSIIFKNLTYFLKTMKDTLEGVVWEIETCGSMFFWTRSDPEPIYFPPISNILFVIAHLFFRLEIFLVFETTFLNYRNNRKQEMLTNITKKTYLLDSIFTFRILT